MRDVSPGSPPTDTAAQPAARSAADSTTDSTTDSTAFRFPGELRFHNACEVLEAAMPALQAPEPRFDLSACEHFDSSLVAVLLELSRQALALGRRCRFVEPSSNLRKLAGLYGVDGLLFAGA